MALVQPMRPSRPHRPQLVAGLTLERWPRLPCSHPFCLPLCAASRPFVLHAHPLPLQHLLPLLLWPLCLQLRLFVPLQLHQKFNLRPCLLHLRLRLLHPLRP